MPTPTLTTTNRKHLWNPNLWPNPDNIGESEYRAIHELAMDVWTSRTNGDGASEVEAAASVESSMENLFFTVKAMLTSPTDNVDVDLLAKHLVETYT